jgi:hypothetical protein
LSFQKPVQEPVADEKLLKTDDSFTICVAHNQEEAIKLEEAGFEPFDVIDGVHLYRKRK